MKKDMHSTEKLAELILKGYSDKEILKRLHITTTGSRSRYRGKLRDIRAGIDPALIVANKPIKQDVNYGRNSAARLAQSVKVDVAGFMAELEGLRGQ
jgi:hypothetical protein